MLIIVSATRYNNLVAELSSQSEAEVCVLYVKAMKALYIVESSHHLVLTVSQL